MGGMKAYVYNGYIDSTVFLLVVDFGYRQDDSTDSACIHGVLKASSARIYHSWTDVLITGFKDAIFS